MKFYLLKNSNSNSRFSKNLKYKYLYIPNLFQYQNQLGNTYYYINNFCPKIIQLYSLFTILKNTTKILMTAVRHLSNIFITI